MCSKNRPSNLGNELFAIYSHVELIKPSSATQRKNLSTALISLPYKVVIGVRSAFSGQPLLFSLKFTGSSSSFFLGKSPLCDIKERSSRQHNSLLKDKFVEVA